LISFQDIVQQLRLFEPDDNTDRVGFEKRVCAAIEKAKKNSLIGMIRGSDDRFEVSFTFKLLFSAEEVEALTSIYDNLNKDSAPGASTERESTRLLAEAKALVGRESQYADALSVSQAELRGLEDRHRDRGGERIEALEQECVRLGEQRDELRDRRRELEQERRGVETEIAAMLRQPSIIPAEMLALRGRIADGLGLNEADLPFVGELIDVRADAAEWQGAIERVLHGFALSLIDKLELESTRLRPGWRPSCTGVSTTLASTTCAPSSISRGR